MFLFITTIAVAHEGGHHNALKTWVIEETNEVIEASFLTMKGSDIVLEDHDGNLHYYAMESLTPADQEIVIAQLKKIHSINGTPTTSTKEVKDMPLLSGLVMFLLALFFLIRRLRQRKKALTKPLILLSISMLLILACKDDSVTKTSNNNASISANNINELQALFEQFSGVTTHSDDSYSYVSSNGLPDHSMMKGITNDRYSDRYSDR